MPDGEARVQTRDPEAIQADIARAREEITRSVLALRERMSAAADWRSWARRRPWALAGAAFGLGFFFGYRSGS